jgi:hypothetical protein
MILSRLNDGQVQIRYLAWQGFKQEPYDYEKFNKTAIKLFAFENIHLKPKWYLNKGYNSLVPWS